MAAWNEIGLKLQILRITQALAGWCLSAMLLFVISMPLQAGNEQSPVLNQGEKWRVAYYQGGEYYDYYQYLKATTEGLMAQGWISPATIPSEYSTTAQLWRWLVDHAQSDYLAFLADGFYSPEWDRHDRELLRPKVLERLRHNHEVDLLLAMGTWAGMDMATDDHRVPTIVMSVSDPRGIGLLTEQGSLYSHLYVSEDPQHYERQVALFHDLIGFKTLGVAYENTLEGRSYASIELIHRLAQERDFKVVSCFTQSDVNDQLAANTSVIDCFQVLAGQVDAIYVTAQGGVNNDTIPQLVHIANQNSIPTFSQYGQREVKMGYLMSLSQIEGYQREGKILSGVASHILHGSSPASLVKNRETINGISLNLKTAEQIGLYLNADLLAAVDHFFWQIEQP
ncbi:ABC transporter substrate-binding protein [Amphritea sp.]|uniref:ABC transporter substrate-binding protein n=1 Tax=Amphritea sp. TaxID=1872502 RepID=UPI003A8FF116